MGNRHLEELRGRLADRDWRVVEETVGEGGRPAVWRIQRRDDAGPFHLEFETINNEEPAPIEQAYGVRIRELKQTSIYLYRKRTDNAWTRVLDELISALDELEA